jgi:hypothetical protein
MPKTTLRVTNLRLTTTSSAGLIEHFLPFRISSVRLNAKEGVALLEIESTESEAAIADKNGSMYHGRLIRVATVASKS